MTGIICVETSHSLSRSYLNHLVFRVAGAWSIRVTDKIDVFQIVFVYTDTFCCVK
jgi:hypothetical protein